MGKFLVRIESDLIDEFRAQHPEIDFDGLSATAIVDLMLRTLLIKLKEAKE